MTFGAGPPPLLSGRQSEIGSTVHGDHAVRQLADALRAERVTFFAGAGVSVESGLPSVNDIVGRTGRSLLPTYWQHSASCGGLERTCAGDTPCHFSWLQDIQPEQFYGLLLQVSDRNMRCLELWRALHEDAQHSSGYTPQPTLIHYAIASYSASAGVPILTVNFDDMFERACRHLGLAYRVFDPDEAPPDVIRGSQHVNICKLHGSVQGPGGRFAPEGIRTTMEGITQRSEHWVRFVQRVMASTHMAFAGYSGRDIDFYPSILDAAVSRKALRPFWFGRFDSSSDPASVETLLRAQACGAHLVPGYPSDLIGNARSELHYSRVLAPQPTNTSSILSTAEQHLRAGQGWALAPTKNALLDQLALALPTADTPESLLWLRVLVETSHLVEAEQEAERLLDGDRSKFTPAQRLLLAADGVVVARERALFRTYRQRARALAQIAKTKGAASPTHLVLARREVTSSLQMEVPSHLPFAPALSPRDLALLLRVLVRFHLLDPLYYLGLGAQYPSHAETLTASPDIAEARIRRLAIWIGLRQRILEVPRPEGSRATAVINRISSVILRLALKELGELEAHAQSNGNYRTLVSVYKYLFRLTGDTDWRLKCERIAALVGDLSAPSILVREMATPSETELGRGIGDSARGGNRLNEIKQTLKLAEHRLQHPDEGSTRRPLVDDWDRLEDLTRAVGSNSPHLRRGLEGCMSRLRAIDTQRLAGQVS